MKKTVFALGEILWDGLPAGDVLGGAPFNFAYRMHALGHRSLLASRVGEDAPGRRALAAVRALGLAGTYIQRDARFPTGRVEVRFDAKGNPDYTVVPGAAYDHIEMTGPLAKAVQAADAVCFGVLAQRSAGSRRTIEALLDGAGAPLAVLDINLRKKCFSRATVARSLERADVLKLNEDEVGVLRRMFSLGGAGVAAAVRAICKTWSLRCCVVTLGARGAFAWSADGGEVYLPGHRVPVADTVGSGDAFAAGFVSVLLRRGTLREACEQGNRLGACVAMQRGATRPVTGRELRTFDLARYPRLPHPEFLHLP
jgi:fructokinase